MKLLLISLFVILPFFSYSQGYRIKVGNKEHSTDSIPDNAVFSEKIKKISLKKNRSKNDKAANSSGYVIVQIGEEEHRVPTDGSYHDVEFSHDVRGLVVYILDEKRKPQGKNFVLKKPKK